jgi:1-deoxy-D-xylulose-5-phosphate reductoisomerase
MEASAQAQAALESSGVSHSDFALAGSIEELLDESDPDVVINAIVGFAGLRATLAALRRGCIVALANKESLVAGGELCMRYVAEYGGTIIPVDSEHSAMAQCLSASKPEHVESVVLTASGGPFRGRTASALQNVSVEQALDHPTWRMGGKITIDSATLMNKGLELIEACVLFNIGPDQVEVVVHPGSIVHAMVRHVDGSLLAHLGWPDMRVPISWAVHYPDRPRIPTERLDLVAMPALQFEEPDLQTFRCLALARRAAELGGGAPCVLNAANEVAVEAFMNGELPFLGIADVVERVLNSHGVDAIAPDSLSAAVELDAGARAAAEAVCADLRVPV